MRRKTKTDITVNVRIRVPSNASVSTVMEYVRDAMSSHKGGLNPQDPLFNIDPNYIDVILLKKETTYA